MDNIIAIASDHAGLELKNFIKNYLEQKQFTIVDLGTNTQDSVDYPDYGKKLAEYVIQNKIKYGIAICGSGVGISIALNRYKEIRCALCYEPELAKLARQHNNANILALGGRFVSQDKAKEIIDTFLNTEFENGRHSTRVDKLIFNC